MKKTFLILLTLAICSTVFAQEISDLYKEFQRRDKVFFTFEQVKALNFVSDMGVDKKTVKTLELFDPEDADKFLIETVNGDICLGEISSDILRCKNEMGLTTVHYNGDAD